MKKICLYITLSLYTIAGIAQSDKDIITIDKKVTAGTKALYFNLLKIHRAILEPLSDGMPTV